MNNQTKLSFGILQFAIVLGVLCDMLLRVTPWGLNVTILTGVLTVAVLFLLRSHRTEYWSANTASLLSAAAIIGLFFSWRDSIELKTIDVFALIVIFSLLILPALKLKVEKAGVFHYVIAGIWAMFNGAFAPFLLIFGDIDWTSLSKDGWRRHLVSVIRGAAIAAPLLFIFGILFVAADKVFEGFVERVLRIDLDVLVQHMVMIGFFTWFSAGYLRGITSEKFFDSAREIFTETEPPKADEATPDVPQSEEAPKVKWNWREPESAAIPAGLTLGPVEIGVSMGLVNALFALFVAFQLPYLFGGFELVQKTEDMKLSEYARRGFGELVFVAALVLPILLFSHWLLRRETPAAEKIYRVMAGIQIGLLFIIMASATQRLLILTGSLGYGLTTVRFYPMVFMIWLAVVFVWFIVTVMRGARHRFAWGALWSALCVLGILHFLNPDDFIVRTNIRLMREGRPFDVSYNASLSADAVPALLETFPEAISAPEPSDDSVPSRVKSHLKWNYCRINRDPDLRNWNLSRFRARKLFESNGDWSSVTGCGSFRGSD